MDRFDIVSAAHQFLLNMLLGAAPSVPDALNTLGEVIRRSCLPAADVDAVLLRCLSVVDSHDERRIPTLVERYLANPATPLQPFESFATCIEEWSRYRFVTDGATQEAIEIIRSRYADPSFGPRPLADALGIRLSVLDVMFRRQIGCTITQHLSSVRLEHAAVLLATSGKSIKEVWVGVGYNHASNFNHEFRRCHGLNPSEFRKRSIRPAARSHFGSATASPRDNAKQSPADIRVLIVDDDECGSTIVGAFLRREGYLVSLARTGGEGLDRVRTLLPETVLLENRLTDMNGLQFLRTLRAHHSGARPAVALFTADWDILGRAEEIRALGATIALKLCHLDSVRELVTALANCLGT